MTDVTPGVPIYYTLDGAGPDTSSMVYKNPIALSAGYTVVKAITATSGYPPTQVAYSVVAQTPTPVINPASGSYPVGQAITITDSNPHATIRYTSDGSTPTSKSSWYHEPLVLTGSETINAIAVSSNEAASEVASAVYTTQ
jgi:hypothetical protein